MTLLDGAKSDLEDDIHNLINDLETEFVLKERLENELGSDDKPLNLFAPEANYHVAENSTIEKTLGEDSSNAEKEVKKGKKKSKEKKKTKEKAKEKAKKMK